MVELRGDGFVLRPWKVEDAGELARVASNIKIARNMNYKFSYPYTTKDAEEWIGIAMREGREDKNFVIEIDGKLAGGIGFDVKGDLNEGVAGGGYWLGEEFWRKGIVSAAWKIVVDYAFENFDIRKMSASVFSWNPASARILEKCGFKREGVFRENVVRFGRVCDEWFYGLLRSEWEKGE